MNLLKKVACKMKKILTKEIGGLRGTVYLYSLGYGFKIVYNKKLVGRSYPFFKNMEDAVLKMVDEMKALSGFDKNLFDLEKI